MTGSVAEERIRAKAETWLRDICPEGRVIHELVMEQWGSRIDLAAVAPDRIIAVEIKSERDVLTRLPHQLEAAGKVVDHLFVAAAPCKVAKLIELHQKRLPETNYSPNPKYIGPWPRDVRMLRETEPGFEAVTEGVFAYPQHTMLHNPKLSPWHRLQMLWASELRQIAGAGSKGARERTAALCVETMTGRQIRFAVCAALRARLFPRADAPQFAARAEAA